MADIPHLALALRVANGSYVSVEQDTIDELQTTVACIALFPVGYRHEAPAFGVPQLELTQDPIDVDAIDAAIAAQENRAAITVTEQPYDPNDPGAARVRIQVAMPGAEEMI